MKLLLLSIQLLLTTTLYAQYTISGKVNDNTNKPVEFVSVLLQRQDAVIKKSVTDNMGRYALNNVQAGSYKLVFSTIELQKQTINLSITGDTVLNLQLAKQTNELKEVVVKQRKAVIEQKADRTIFNVENSTATIGLDALGALAKTPGVKVDNKSISLVGKGQVTIMIDEKPMELTGDDLMNLLRSMSAGDIAKIEVIANPGAQYDASGSNGLINIVTKRSNKVGYSGAFRMGYTQTTYAQLSTGGNFNYSKNKLKLYSNLNLNQGSSAFTENLTYYSPIENLAQNNRTREFNQSLESKFDIDYFLNKNTTLGAAYQGSFGQPDSRAVITSPTTLANDSYTLYGNTNANRNNYTNGIDIYLKQKLDTAGKSISIRGSWLQNATNGTETVLSSNSTDIMASDLASKVFSQNTQRITSFNLKTDATLPLRLFSLSAGGKLSFRDIENSAHTRPLSNDGDATNYTQNNRFEYRENIQALYATLDKQIKKWTFQLGLRGEFTQI